MLSHRRMRSQSEAAERAIDSADRRNNNSRGSSSGSSGDECSDSEGGGGASEHSTDYEEENGEGDDNEDKGEGAGEEELRPVAAKRRVLVSLQDRREYAAALRELIEAEQATQEAKHDKLTTRGRGLLIANPLLGMGITGRRGSSIFF